MGPEGKGDGAHVMQQRRPRVEVFDGAYTEQSLARLDLIARLMDGAFVLPGTNIRMGLDALIGVVPVVGDLVSGVISSYLIWEAKRLGAPRWLIARMVANTAIDTVFGAVPVLGDAFDVLFRANLKNMALLRKHLARKGMLGAGAGRGPVIEGEAVRIN